MHDLQGMAAPTHERTSRANDERLQDPLYAGSTEASICRLLPPFSPASASRIDYLVVQFHSAGGSFVVELGRTGPNGFTEGPWKDLSIDKINVGHISMTGDG